MWTKVFLMLACVVFVSADTEKIAGPCHDVPEQKPFNPLKFAKETWYLVQHSEDDELKCVALNVKLRPKMTFQLTGFRNGVYTEISVPFDVVSPGVFMVEDMGDEFDGESKIIATDYLNYCISYRCSYDASDDTHRDHVSIHVRSKDVANPEEAIASAKAAIEGKDVHPKHYKNVEHTDCNH